MDYEKPDPLKAVIQALALLKQCTTTDGLLASPTDKANYRLIWRWDGIMAHYALKDKTVLRINEKNTSLQ